MSNELFELVRHRRSIRRYTFGIGACWIHIRDRAGQRTTADEEIRQLLGVPNKYSVLNVVALGQKNEKKSPRTESDLHLENIHIEKY